MASTIPTDPHEEKWSRLVLSAKRDEVKATEIDVKLNDYISYTKTNNASAYSFQNQQFKELSKQNEFMKSYNDKLLRSLEDAQRTKTGFGRTGGFDNAHYQSNFIINPEQISPLVKTSEDRIHSLEEEMYTREREMNKMAGIIDLLIEENKYLRDHIAFKNKDITRILETIGLNDGESVHDLRHRLNLLTEENNLLLAHLEELKGIKENNERFSKDKNYEIDKIREIYENTKRGFEEALRREEALTNFKQLMEPKYNQLLEKNSELERNIDDYMNEINQLKNNQLLLSNQSHHYKKTLEEIDGKKSLEIDKLVQEINILQNEKKEYKKTIEFKEKTFDHSVDESRKARKEMEHLRLEYEEAVQVINDLKNQLANERQRIELAQKREKDYREKSDRLNVELEKLTIRLQTMESGQHKLSANLQSDYESKILKMQQAYENMKSSKLEIAAEKDAEIKSLLNQITDMKRNLERIREEKNNLSRQLRQVQESGTVEVTEKDKLIESLENEVEKLNHNIQELESAKRENERKLQKMHESVRDENEKLNESNKQLLNELNERKREYNRDLEKTTKIERNMKQSPERSSVYEVDTLKKMIDDLKNENFRIKTNPSVANEEISKMIFALQDENNRLKQGGGNTTARTSELEKENTYLHQMIRNMVKAEETNAAMSSPPRTETRTEYRVEPRAEQKVEYKVFQEGMSPNIEYRIPANAQVTYIPLSDQKMIQNPKLIEQIRNAEPYSVTQAQQIIDHIREPYTTYSQEPSPFNQPYTQTYTQAPTTQTYTQAPSTITYSQAPTTQTYTQAPITQTFTQAPITQSYTQAPITQTYTQAPITQTYTQVPSFAGQSYENIPYTTSQGPTFTEHIRAEPYRNYQPEQEVRVIYDGHPNNISNQGNQVNQYSYQADNKNVDIDSVVNNILKKYNLQQVPEVGNSNNVMQGGIGTSPDGKHTQSIDAREYYEPGRMKSSNLHYLSPILSTERKELKEGLYDSRELLRPSQFQQ